MMIVIMILMMMMMIVINFFLMTFAILPGTLSSLIADDNDWSQLNGNYLVDDDDFENVIMMT